MVEAGIDNDERRARDERVRRPVIACGRAACLHLRASSSSNGENYAPKCASRVIIITVINRAQPPYGRSKTRCGATVLCLGGAWPERASTGRGVMRIAISAPPNATSRADDAPAPRVTRIRRRLKARSGNQTHFCINSSICIEAILQPLAASSKSQNVSRVCVKSTPCDANHKRNNAAARPW